MPCLHFCRYHSVYNAVVCMDDVKCICCFLKVKESNTVTTKRNMLIAAVRQRKEGTGGDGSSSGSGEANTYIHDGMAVQEQPSPASGNSANQTSHSLPLESTPSSSMQSDGETQKPDAAKKYSYLDTHQLMMVVVALGTVLTTVLIVCLLVSAKCLISSIM